MNPRWCVGINLQASIVWKLDQTQDGAGGVYGHQTCTSYHSDSSCRHCRLYLCGSGFHTIEAYGFMPTHHPGFTNMPSFSLHVAHYICKSAMFLMEYSFFFLLILAPDFLCSFTCTWIGSVPDLPRSCRISLLWFCLHYGLYVGSSSIIELEE